MGLTLALIVKTQNTMGIAVSMILEGEMILNFVGLFYPIFYSRPVVANGYFTSLSQQDSLAPQK